MEERKKLFSLTELEKITGRKQVTLKMYLDRNEFQRLVHFRKDKELHFELKESDLKRLMNLCTRKRAFVDK